MLLYRVDHNQWMGVHNARRRNTLKHNLDEGSGGGIHRIPMAAYYRRKDRDGGDNYILTTKAISRGQEDSSGASEGTSKVKAKAQEKR